MNTFPSSWLLEMGQLRRLRLPHFPGQFFMYVNFELPQALTRLYRQCSLAQCIVNGLPSHDEPLAALIMLISVKSFNYIYPVFIYIHIATVVSIGTDLHKRVPPECTLSMALMAILFLLLMPRIGASVYYGCPFLSNFLSIAFNLIVEDSSL